MPGRRVATLCDDLGLELAAALEEFDPRVRLRGRECAARGAVVSLQAAGRCIEAVVVGTVPHDVFWGHEDDGGWLPDCTCSAAPYCKHAYAAALTALGEHYEEGGRAAPASVVVRAEPPLVRPAKPARPAAGAAGGATEDLLRQMATVREPWLRQQVVADLLVDGPVPSHLWYVPSLASAAAEDEPEIACWRLAAEIRRLAGGEWLPAALEPFRDRPDLAARVAERARQRLLHDVLGWSAAGRRSAERRLRAVVSLEATEGGRSRLRVEARLTTAKRADAPRTMRQLEQLRSELRRDPALLAPEQAALLAWLVEHRVGGSDAYGYAYGYQGVLDVVPATTLLGFLEQLAASGLGSWDERLAGDLAGRGGIVPGGPVRVSPLPAQLLPACSTRNGAVQIELRFVWPDGRTRRTDEIVHLGGHGGPSSLVVADGSVSAVTVEPPGELVERLRAFGAVAVTAAERGPVLGALAERYPHVRAAVAAHTRWVRATAVVTLDLRDDDWLQVRLFAAEPGWQPGRPLPSGVVVFEHWPDRGWVRLEDAPAGAASEPIGADPAGPPAAGPSDAAVATGPAAAPEPVAGAGPAAAPEPASAPGEPPMAEPADVWLELPEPACVEAAVAWADALAAGPPGQPRPPQAALDASGRWLQANRRRVEALAEAWDRRPPEAAYYGSERARRLLDGSARIVPRLRVAASGIDWFAVSAEWEAEGLTLGDADLAALRTATTRLVRLSSGWVRREVAADHAAAARALADLGLEAGQEPRRLGVLELAGVRAESLAVLERLGADAATVEAVRELRRRIAAFTGLPQVPPPRGLTATLRPYQQRGLDFLAHAASLGVGAVLADDMGLGKTLQALAWLAHLRETDPAGGPSLVVCPASVVHNWRREAARFMPDLRVLVLERGPERHALRAELASHDLVVTTYALLRQDAEAWSTVSLRAAILDEAQNVKNPDAVTTRAALALRARHRLALTGTPLENRALDLWSIMAFVNPGFLGPRAAFTARYDRADAPPYARALLAARLRPVLLRRLKREVAPELPPRIEERRDCELTPGQRRLYLAELQRSRALAAAIGGDDDLRRQRFQVLAALTRLRQVCCHPALVGGRPGLGSGKLDALLELLEPLLAEGHKVLVFSQFVECLALVAAALRRERIRHHVLTGETVRRQEVVDAFTADPEACVFLVSLRAGGTGLNLTAATYVVLFDPWWNPAVEAQAIDRTHRIGQTGTVVAYRLLARGTVEEKIWELQQRKAALVRDVLGEGEFGRALTRDDLAFLLEEPA